VTNSERLKDIIKKKSFRYSEKPIYSLASGKLSNFYFDCKKTTMDPEGAALIGELVFEKIMPWKPAGIGGLTLGADPIAAATMYAAWQKGERINQFVVRKKLKDHGDVKWIEGNVQSGDRVVIVDDVVTTGGSTIQAIAQAKVEHLEIAGVLILVDRQESEGMENIRKHVLCPVIPLYTRDEFMDGDQPNQDKEKYHRKHYYAQST